MAKLKSIIEEENMRAREPLPVIPHDEETTLKIASMLRDISSSLNNMMRGIIKWYAITGDDARMRDYLYTVRNLTVNTQILYFCANKDSGIA
jgi:hypothetical protein